MMEDEKVAKSFLSAIIKEEVVELNLVSQNHAIWNLGKSKKQEEKFLTVCRFDFSAKILPVATGVRRINPFHCTTVLR
jgi:UDP-N-acetylglucosamine transferase subunit ALG13